MKVIAILLAVCLAFAAAANYPRYSRRGSYSRPVHYNNNYNNNYNRPSYGRGYSNTRRGYNTRRGGYNSYNRRSGYNNYNRRTSYGSHRPVHRVSYSNQY
ncbi:hypothetical protein EB796_002702 [Bugula neritina]|uniref:Uncharacterized protein n=1 Tax=Bugula neritina TaxID=10212 RepID=A0A7J7KLI3_BUGNE|nr:hypothetical protein EB796_002702 [Bugula neritina]